MIALHSASRPMRISIRARVSLTRVDEKPVSYASRCQRGSAVWLAEWLESRHPSSAGRVWAFRACRLTEPDQEPADGAEDSAKDGTSRGVLTTSTTIILLFLEYRWAHRASADIEGWRPMLTTSTTIMPNLLGWFRARPL